MKFKQLLITLGVVNMALFPGVSFSQDDESNRDEIKALRKRIDDLEQKLKQLEQNTSPTQGKATEQQVQELEQKVKILERNSELDQEAAHSRSLEAPKVTLGEQGFSFSSPDGSFGVQVKGVLQVDSRTFFKDGGIVGNDGLLLRRARPILQGTVFSNIDFVFVPDF